MRISKFAEHWSALGHEVRVLTRDLPDSGTLEAPHHDNLSEYRVRDPFARRISNAKRSTAKHRGLLRRIITVVASKLLSLIWPDIYARWSRKAFVEAKNWNWSPEVVVASVGPFSTLLLGARTARHFDAKLAVDYRDLLSISSYYPFGKFRKTIDRICEKRIVRKASLLATVSEPLAGDLRREYQRPTVVVTNGFDPRDFEALTYAPTEFSKDTLEIVYCGWVIPKKRDPRPFLAGVKQFVSENPDRNIRVSFYGPNSAEVAEVIEELELHSFVSQNGQVSHEESLRIQAEADVLLLLLWNNPGEMGVLSGKVFEYIGANRPVLMTGFKEGAAGSLIRDNNLGFVENDPSLITNFLLSKSEEKIRQGYVNSPDFPDRELFSRANQSQVFLDSISQMENEL